MITNFTSAKLLFPRLLVSAIKFNLLYILVMLFAFQASAGTLGTAKGLESGLPVFTTELIVSAAGHNLVISWQANRESINYYEVQKSADAINYSTIGLVLDAPENSNICLFKDKRTTDPKVKAVWYRIKAIDKNGIISYSAGTNMVIDKSPLNCESEAFPNPFNNTTVLKFKSSEAGFAQITVNTLDGQTLLSKQSNINVGYNSISLDGLASLSKGIYVARITINGMVAGNQKLIKK